MKIDEQIRLTQAEATELAEYIKQDAARGKTSRAVASGGDSLQAVHDDYLGHVKRLELLKKEPDKARAFKLLETFAAESRQLADQRLINLKTGAASALIARASADRWRYEMSERGKAESFARQRLLYEASPHMYMLDRWLDTWDAALANKHKYVLGLDPNRIEHWFKWEGQSGVMPGMFGGSSNDDGK
jgi:hypothetical protein